MRYRPADGVMCEVIDGQANLVRPDGTELLRLNAVGTLVWQALTTDGVGADAGALADAVRQQVEGATSKEIRADVAAFLDELVGAGVLQRA